MSQQQPDTSDWNSISALAGCILDVVVRIIPFDHAWWQTPRVSCGQKRANHIRLGGLSADQMAHLRAHNPAEYTRACEVLSELYCSNVAINPSFDLPRYWCKGNLPKKRLAEVELIRTLYDLLAIVLPVPPVADIHRTRANMPQPDPSSPSAPRRLPVQPFLQLWSVHTPSASSDQGGAAPYLAGGAGGSRGGWKTLLDEVLMHKFVCRNGLPWIQCARTHTPPTAASQPPVCTSGFSSLGHTDMAARFRCADLQFMLFLAQFTTSSINQRLSTTQASTSGRCRWAVRLHQDNLLLLHEFLHGRCVTAPSDASTHAALMAVQTELHRVQDQYGLLRSPLTSWPAPTGMPPASETQSQQPPPPPAHQPLPSAVASPPVRILPLSPPVSQHPSTASTLTAYTDGGAPDAAEASSFTTPQPSEVAALLALVEQQAKQLAEQQAWFAELLANQTGAQHPPQEDAAGTPCAANQTGAQPPLQQAAAGTPHSSGDGFVDALLDQLQGATATPERRPDGSPQTRTPGEPPVGAPGPTRTPPQGRPEVPHTWSRVRCLHSSAAPGQSCMAVRPSGSTLAAGEDHFGWYGVFARANDLATSRGPERFCTSVRDAIETRTRDRARRGVGTEWKQINGEMDRGPNTGPRRMVPLDKHKAPAVQALRDEWARLAKELAPLFGSDDLQACCEVIISKSQHPPTGGQEWHIDISPNDGPSSVWGPGPVAVHAVVVFTPISYTLDWDLDILPGTHQMAMEEQPGPVMNCPASEDDCMPVTVLPGHHLIMHPALVHRGTAYPDRLPADHRGGNLYVGHCIIAPCTLAQYFSRNKPNGVRNGLRLDGTRLTPLAQVSRDPRRPGLPHLEPARRSQRDLSADLSRAAWQPDAYSEKSVRSEPPAVRNTRLQSRPAAYLGCDVLVTFADVQDASIKQTYQGVVQEYDRHRAVFRIHFPADPEDDNHWVKEPTVRQQLDYTVIKCDICSRTCREHPGCDPDECRATQAGPTNKRGPRSAGTLIPCTDGLDGEHMLMCDTCPAVRHLKCDTPPRSLRNETQLQSWNCPTCLAQSAVICPN